MRDKIYHAYLDRAFASLGVNGQAANQPQAADRRYPYDNGNATHQHF